MIHYKDTIKASKSLFNFKTTNLSQMHKNINSFKSTNTVGNDYISSKIVKDQLYVLTPIMTHIYNITIISNEYPNDCKIMKVIPVLKKEKEISDPYSYRDINMSNFLAKVIDKLLYKNMLQFLEANEILSYLHMGGVMGNSIINALELIHEKLKKSRINNTPSILIGLDQASAFTMINHFIMLKKLKHIGFSSKSLSLMKSYLEERKQVVIFNGSTSSIKNIGNQGCFQGTIMATLLYVLYVLDQPSISHINCEHQNNYKDNEDCNDNLSINYIDDNLSVITANNWNTIEEKTEEFLKNQKEYHINNELVFNEEKTMIMINSKSKKNKKKKIKFNNKILKHNDKIKILGMVYNDKLNFQNHIIKGNKKQKSLIIRLKQKLNLIKNIKYWMNIDELKKIANAYVNGIIQYGIKLWSRENIKLIDKIEKIRIEVIESIFGKEKTKNMNMNDKLNLMNWNTIEEQAIISNNIEIHKIMTIKKPIKKYRELTDDRNQDEIKYKMIKTIIRSHNKYNLIPFLIRTKNIKIFKKSSKNYRFGTKYRIKVIKNPKKNKYTIVWPGE